MTGGAALKRMLARFGRQVVLRRGEEEPRTGRAFLQAVLERREDWRQSLPTPLGEIRQDRFLYLGEPGLPLEEGQVVECMGRDYRVEAAQPIYLGEELSHWWAVLRPERGEGGEA